MPFLKLQSSDGEVFLVDYEIAKASETIKTMVEHLGLEEDNVKIIPLPKVNGIILKKIIQWATYHKDDPPPIEDYESLAKRTDFLCSWDNEFLKMDQGTLSELMIAANDLDIKRLLWACCKTVANMITGKKAEEARKILNIKNDLTPEQEEQIRKE